MRVSPLLGVVLLLAALMVSLPGYAADLNVETLPADTQGFKLHIQQILGQADALIAKLKDNEEARAIVLDLMQTRDNVLREMLKAETTPDGAKWTAKEGRASVQAMLRLLKDQYEKASSMAS